MKRTLFYSLVTAFTLTLLTSCCHSKCRPWTEKDCYYSDYYQSEPIAYPCNQNYYHSDPAR